MAFSSVAGFGPIAAGAGGPASGAWATLWTLWAVDRNERVVSTGVGQNDRDVRVGHFEPHRDPADCVRAEVPVLTFKAQSRLGIVNVGIANQAVLLLVRPARRLNQCSQIRDISVC